MSTNFHVSELFDIVGYPDAPEGDGYEHRSEGPDDMPAHIKAMLTGTALTVPLADGRMMLGSWQGVYLVEHRHKAHKRYIVAHAMGD